MNSQTWKKFGEAQSDNPKGPDQATTVRADEVFLVLTTNKEVCTCAFVCVTLWNPILGVYRATAPFTMCTVCLSCWTPHRAINCCLYTLVYVRMCMYVCVIVCVISMCVSL